MQGRISSADTPGRLPCSLCLGRPIRQHATGRQGLYRTLMVEAKKVSSGQKGPAGAVGRPAVRCARTGASNSPVCTPVAAAASGSSSRMLARQSLPCEGTGCRGPPPPALAGHACKRERTRHTSILSSPPLFPPTCPTHPHRVQMRLDEFRDMAREALNAAPKDAARGGAGERGEGPTVAEREAWAEELERQFWRNGGRWARGGRLDRCAGARSAACRGGRHVDCRTQGAGCQKAW